MKNGVKLSTQLTVVTSALIAVTALISVLVTLYFGQRIARQSIDKKLNTSQLVQEAFTDLRLRQLELISLIVASDPAFVAYIAQATYQLDNQRDDVDLASIADLLLERKQQFGFDIAYVADADGRQIARSDQPMAAVRDLQNKTLMQQALDQLVPVSGYWQEADRVYQAAIVPLARGQNLIGFLLTGLQVDDRLTGQIGRLSGTDAVIVQHQAGNILPIGSTLDIDQTNALLQAAQAKRSTEVAADGHLELNVGGLSLATRSSTLTQLEGDTSIEILSAVSIDQTLQPFINTRNILLAAGSVMIVLAFVVAGLFVRRALRPLQHISQATKAVAEGHYDSAFPQRVGQDLQELNQAINHLVRDLRGKDDLSRHMVEISKKAHQSTDMTGDVKESAKVMHSGRVLINRYHVLEQLGSGGMGIVFKAIDQELDEIIALKMLKQRGDNEADVARFKDEIRLARRISHPNVVRIHDYGQMGSSVFISMEFVQGYTLQQLLKHAFKLRPHAAMHVSQHICKGLIAAHEAGVVHRDLKPANIIVELDATIKLMDFGIARAAHAIGNSKSEDMVEGTAGYLAPEQAMGKGSDERTDIYALGVLMMEMFTGRKPFTGDTEEQVMLKHMNAEPRPISDHWQDAPQALVDLILACLAKRPSERPQSVQSVFTALENVPLK